MILSLNLHFLSEVTWNNRVRVWAARWRLAGAWPQIHCSEWLSSGSGLLALTYLDSLGCSESPRGPSWLEPGPRFAVAKEAVKVEAKHDSSGSFETKRGLHMGSMPALRWEVGFLSIPWMYPCASAEIWTLQPECRLRNAGDGAGNFVSKLLQSQRDIALKHIKSLLAFFKEIGISGFESCYNIAEQIPTGLAIGVIFKDNLIW